MRASRLLGHVRELIEQSAAVAELNKLVNLTRVKSLRAHMNGEYFLRLDGGQELKLSRTYRDKVEYFLKRPRAH